MHSHRHVYKCMHTVLTFNYCTKCVGSRGIAHDRSPDSDQFTGHGCIDDLTTERSFGSRATWVIRCALLIFMTSYPWEFKQPGTGGRPGDWCRYWMSALYTHTCMHAYIHTYTHIYAPKHTFIHKRTYIHTDRQKDKVTFIWTRMTLPTSVRAKYSNTIKAAIIALRLKGSIVVILEPSTLFLSIRHMLYLNVSYLTP